MLALFTRRNGLIIGSLTTLLPVLLLVLGLFNWLAGLPEAIRQPAEALQSVLCIAGFCGALLVGACTHHRMTRTLAGILAVGPMLLIGTCWHVEQSGLGYGEENLPKVLPFLLLACFSIVLTVLLTPTVLAMAIRELRDGVRAKSGLCVECGYNLTGLRDPRCPECGTPFDPNLLRQDKAKEGPSGPPSQNADQ